MHTQETAQGALSLKHTICTSFVMSLVRNQRWRCVYIIIWVIACYLRLGAKIWFNFIDFSILSRVLVEVGVTDWSKEHSSVFKSIFMAILCTQRANQALKKYHNRREKRGPRWQLQAWADADKTTCEGGYELVLESSRERITKRHCAFESIKSCKFFQGSLSGYLVKILCIHNRITLFSRTLHSI